MVKNITASDLGFHVTGEESELFRWFLASYLFGKRIQQAVARRTWEVFMNHHVDTPKKISNQSWQQLVDLLGEGHYRRYDESTARNLLLASDKLIKDYGGKICNMYEASSDEEDFKRKLNELKGVGPKTVEIFLREVEPVLYGRKVANGKI
ncbi:MAG: hypothetical protein ACM3KH_00585 [Thiobacillus sp.]